MTDRTCKILAAVATPFVIGLLIFLAAVSGMVLEWLIKLPILGPVIAVVGIVSIGGMAMYIFWESLKNSCIDYWRGKEN